MLCLVLNHLAYKYGWYMLFFYLIIYISSRKLFQSINKWYKWRCKTWKQNWNRKLERSWFLICGETHLSRPRLTRQPSNPIKSMFLTWKRQIHLCLSGYVDSFMSLNPNISSTKDGQNRHFTSAISIPMINRRLWSGIAKFPCCRGIFHSNSFTLVDSDRSIWLRKQYFHQRNEE